MVIIYHLLSISSLNTVLNILIWEQKLGAGACFPSAMWAHMNSSPLTSLPLAMNAFSDLFLGPKIQWWDRQANWIQDKIPIVHAYPEQWRGDYRCGPSNK